MARTKNIWVVTGVSDENPVKVAVRNGETVRDFKERYADELGVSNSNIEISTDTKKLLNENAELNRIVSDNETIHVIPRAKAGI